MGRRCDNRATLYSGYDEAWVIASAYETLSDEKARTVYDRKLLNARMDEEVGFTDSDAFSSPTLSVSANLNGAPIPDYSRFRVGEYGGTCWCSDGEHIPKFAYFDATQGSRLASGWDLRMRIAPSLWTSAPAS
eukprot:9480328-Pyramimonas_sp.AAC.1